MVKLHSSRMFVKDPVDAWGEETTIGLAEHAVRTQAPPLVYDRRGGVIRWVDFESSTPNYEIDKTVGSAFDRSTNTAHAGSFSGKVDVPASASDYCRIIQYINDFHLGKMGLSAQFASADTAFDLHLKLQYHDGVTVHDAELMYKYSTGALFVNTPTGSVGIDSVDRYASIYNFSTIKVVADFSTDKYVRALMFGNEYDLSAYTIRTAGSASIKHIEPRFEIVGAAGSAATAYVDDIILTENEAGN